MTTPEPSESDSPTSRYPRVRNVLLGKPLTALRAAQIIAAVTVAVTVIAGLLIRVADARDFPNIGDGLWWAIQTVTTVGYGDVVPTNRGGRVIAALVMIVGIGFLTVITAAITSIFIESSRRRVEGLASDAIATRLDQIVARLDAIEATLTNTADTSRDDPQ
jgi:voltage-gated potassium channel